MRACQCDAIEARRDVIKNVLIEKANIISGKIALGTLIRVTRKQWDKDTKKFVPYYDFVNEAIQYINDQVDKRMGINR